MFDVAGVVSDATREVERRDAGAGKGAQLVFNASFIFGGQIAGDQAAPGAKAFARCSRGCPSRPGDALTALCRRQ
jgi:hypothetical protein